MLNECVYDDDNCNKNNADYLRQMVVYCVLCSAGNVTRAFAGHHRQLSSRHPAAMSAALKQHGRQCAGRPAYSKAARHPAGHPQRRINSTYGWTYGQRCGGVRRKSMRRRPTDRPTYCVPGASAGAAAGPWRRLVCLGGKEPRSSSRPAVDHYTSGALLGSGFTSVDDVTGGLARLACK